MSRVVVLVSGRGSNLGAILAARSPARVVAVISNRPGAAGLDIARKAGVGTLIVDHTRFDSRDAFDEELATQIDLFEPDLVVLAGFMRVLTSTFVERYRGRMLNVHPSLLPCFPGLKTHQRALDAGVRIHGATVHFVTSDLDHGPIVSQAAVPVLQGDTPETLAQRVLAAEHQILPAAIHWFAQGRLRLTDDGRVQVEPEPAPAGVLLSPALDPII